MYKLWKSIFFVVFIALSFFGNSQLFQDDFGTAFGNLDVVKWPSACRVGASSFNTGIGSCAGTSDRSYGLNGFGSYITSQGIAIPSAGYTLSFDYQFDYFSFSAPDVEIRTGGACGTSVSATITLAVAATCTSESINLDAFAGQTIFIRFVSNTSSETFYIDNVLVDGTGGGGGSGDYKWADNFNDNNLTLNYAGNDGDEACVGCGDWTLGAGATLNLVPSGGWNGNSLKTEAFPDNMSNVYYAKLDRNEYIESPTIDMSGKTSLKISFYAKSSSSGTGGGDSWSSFSDHLRLQIWDGSSWLTVKDITEGTSTLENKISPALPFNYFCFTAYNDVSAPGNYYYTNAPNVNSSYFTADFKFRVIFEGGFSGAPYAWVDDFTFRADSDGYSTMIPCGISFWNEPAATGYGQDPGATALNDSERGVELELDNSISIPPNWATQANDGDVVDQVFGSGESERIVFCVLSEQEVNFAFPVVSFSAPSIGNRSSVMSKDNNYTGPGWKYYAVEYISCDLASSTIAEPTDQFVYHYVFEYGNEFIPVFYQLNQSGIEMGGGVTSSFERFDKPDVTSTDNCGLTLPVELVNFDVTQLDDNVLLEWETVSELNNDYFEIQRGIDGVDFESIDLIDGAGNSTRTIGYQFEDIEPILGDSYYRLKQVDFDGKTSFSQIERVNFSGSGATIFPNPTTGLVHLSDNSIKKVDIVTPEGTYLKSLFPKNEMIDLSHVPSGIYFLYLRSNDIIQVEKIIIE